MREKSCNPSQLAVIQSLLAGETYTQAAAQAGINRATIYKWFRSDAVFVATYNRFHQEQITSAAHALQALIPRALTTLSGLLSEPTPPALRLRAALGILATQERLLTHQPGTDNADAIQGAWLQEQLFSGSTFGK